MDVPTCEVRLPMSPIPPPLPLAFPSPPGQPAAGAGPVAGEPGAALATVLFADLRHFTRLSHRLGPAATFALVEEYCRLIQGCIGCEQSCIDHFTGDGAMAVFGIGSAGAGADQAVRAALAMRRALAAWNRVRLRAGEPALAAGIGIDSGAVIVRRLEAIGPGGPVCVGDAVNVAARLEKACKLYATGILISHHVRRLLSGDYDIRPVDTVLIAGRREAIDLFEVLDRAPPAAAALRQTRLALADEAVGLYRQQRFGEAADRWQRLAALDPDDAVARRLGERCRKLRDRPRGDGWRPITIVGGG